MTLIEIEQQLWEKQLEEWPLSERLTPSQVYGWVTSNPIRLSMRALQIVDTLQYAHGVFYRIPHSTGEYRGYRYGLEDSEYLSFY